MKDITFEILKRRHASIIFLVILAVLGVSSLLQLGISLYPKTDKPKIQMYVACVGYTAADLYDNFASDLDVIVDSVEEAEKITAEYSDNRITYVFEFPWKYDSLDAKNKVYNITTRVNSVFEDEGDDVDDAQVKEMGGGSGFLSTALYSSNLSSVELYNEATNLLESRFKEKVIDADEINVYPVQELKADVVFDSPIMLSFNLNPQVIVDKIDARFTNESMGSFRDGNSQYALRYLADVDTIFDIGSMVVANVNKQDILLNDVANVNVRYDLPFNIYRANGESAVFIIAKPKQTGNIRTMAQDIQTVLSDALPHFSDKVSYEVFVDPAVFIDSAIQNVVNSALTGGLLAILVTLVFMGIPKNSIIVILSIPLSVIYSFILIKTFGISINIISLSGIALSVGMTVDVAIVLMENIHRHRIHSLKNNLNRPLYDIIVSSIAEVRMSAFAGVITSICVFLPLAFTAPLANAILGDLALCVVFILMSSLLVAFVSIPISAYYLFKNEHKADSLQSDSSGKPKNIFSKFNDFLENFSNKLMSFLTSNYERSLTFLMNSKALKVYFIVITIITLFFTLSFVMKLIPTEIMAKPDSNKIYIFGRNPQIDSVEKFLPAAEQVEKEVIDIIGEDKLANRFLETRGNTFMALLVTLKSTKDTNDIIDRLNMQLSSDEWTFHVQQWDPAQMPLPVSTSLKIRITGSDRLTVLGYMEQVQDIISKSDLYTSIWTNPPTKPNEELSLIARKEVLKELAIKDTSLSDLSKIYLSGTSLTLYENREEVRVKFQYPEIDNVNDVLNIQIPYDGTSLPLNHFFETIYTSNISRIVVENTQESYYIYANVASNSKDGATALAQKEAMIKNLVEKNITLDAGYNIMFIDAQEDTKLALNSLTGAFLLSVIFIFLVLAIQFNNYIYPLVIIIAIPLGLIGAILSLKIFNSTLSINSFLGIILLGGTAVNNSIMIVEFYLNRLKTCSQQDAIIESCKLRLAPILTSTMTTLLGMLPIAIALGDGSNVIQPLGIAVCGGLTFSTFFTLYLIPSVLSLLPKIELESTLN